MAEGKGAGGAATAPPDDGHNKQDGHSELQHPPRTAEALDKLVTTTTTGGWIALVTAVIAIVAALVWASIARVPQSLDDTAVISSPGNITAVVAPAAGTVALAIDPGAEVKQGQQLGTITPLGGGTPVAVTAPTDGLVFNSDIVNGTAVQPGTELLVIDNRETGQTAEAVTFLPANRAQRYTEQSQITLSWADLSSGQTYEVPGSVTSVLNVPADEETIRAVTGSQAAADRITDNRAGPLYAVELSATDLSSIPADARPIDGQLVLVTNTYAQPHPIELLFGGEG